MRDARLSSAALLLCLVAGSRGAAAGLEGEGGSGEAAAALVLSEEEDLAEYENMMVDAEGEGAGEGERRELKGEIWRNKVSLLRPGEGEDDVPDRV